ncbi:MAG: PDZ domain-containing protein, partial [Desulfobacterales bacterium]|nr:PDZ domain-containing protein [Desulfobacterales bacterium]
EPPTRVTLDEEYDLMRGLTMEETPPVLAKVMGKRKPLVAMPEGRGPLYTPVLDALGIRRPIVKAPEEITFSMVKEHSLIIAGYDVEIGRMLLGRRPAPGDGVRLRVFKNPYNEREVIMLIHARDEKEVKAVARKLSHYGKYGELAFDNGKNTHKSAAETFRGVPVLRRDPSMALAPGAIPTLEEILPGLVKSRVIYVGEQHGGMAGHINQLMIIKALHETGEKVAVGMEMFQRPRQSAIDDYMAGRIDERVFLKNSGYFEHWRYDYNLYKPIIDYVKKEKIPLVALNIDGEITRKTAKQGLSALTDEEKERLPREMDFSNAKYRDDLREVFDMHRKRQTHDDFDYFLQAQILWDETMAESAHVFLAEHPGVKMVILAGNGHVAYKYGIPDRLHRRNQEPFTVIVQDQDPLEGVADYVLSTSSIEGVKAPRLGVGVEEKGGELHVVSVGENTPAGKAGLEKGDAISGMGDQEIHDLADLKFALFQLEMDSEVSIRIVRDGKEITKKLTLFDFARRHP